MVTGKFAHTGCSESVKDKKTVGFSSSKIGVPAMFGCQKSGCLDGGFKDFLFSPLFGEDSHFDYFFQRGWNHQLVVDWDNNNFPVVFLVSFTEQRTTFGELWTHHFSCFVDFLAKQIEVMRGAQSRSSRLVFYVDMDFGAKEDVFFSLHNWWFLFKPAIKPSSSNSPTSKS